MNLKLKTEKDFHIMEVDVIKEKVAKVEKLTSCVFTYFQSVCYDNALVFVRLVFYISCMRAEVLVGTFLKS